ncbi:MAG: ATP-binding protein [Proteobacteria bacterium]|nr:ATP-binding protein [Pseudomonadota bacterium]
MIRYLSDFIRKDLEKKLVLLAGPRQVGKTWLSKALFPAAKCTYLNFDRNSDRKIIIEETWSRETDIVILDEIHKMKNWKSWIKGIFDTEGVRPRLLLTGSARLDVSRRGGPESLAGRHHLHRLHPLSVRELSLKYSAQEAFERLMIRGGFPEPFFADHNMDADRWRLSHLDSMLREDLRDLVVIQDIKSLEYLVDRLASQVGSPVSYQSLAEDVGVSAPTIKRWISVLESIYVIFAIQPWTKKVKGSLLKQPKIYFFDTGRIPENLESARFENLVANHLLKHQQFLEDTRGVRGSLCYLRNKKGLEVDFLLVEKSQPTIMVECKLTATEDVNFHHFASVGAKNRPVLLIRNNCRDLTYETWDQKNAAVWLNFLES